MTSLDNQGFTFLELLCCMAILAILTCAALPSFHTWLSKIRLQQVTHDIKHAIRYARNLAILEEKTAILAPINGRAWSDGIQLQLKNDQHILNKDAILYMWEWHLTAVKINWIGFEHQQQIQFSHALNHATSNGYFIIESGRLRHKIILNRLGRIRELEASATEGEA